MIVGRSCSPCSPVDPHTNSAISTIDNAKPREEFPGFPGQGGNVQSGEFIKTCFPVEFSFPFPTVYCFVELLSSMGGNSYALFMLCTLLMYC